KVIALGVTGRERHKARPNVPAIAEFYPGYELTAFLGLAAPARTPPEVIDALHELLLRALADPGVTQSFDRLGMATRPMRRDEHLTDQCENVTNSFIFLATLIRETKTIRLGTGTSNLSHAHPTLVAAHAAMFDHLSRGRFIFGISPGALSSDAEALGILKEDR